MRKSSFYQAYKFNGSVIAVFLNMEVVADIGLCIYI